MNSVHGYNAELNINFIKRVPRHNMAIYESYYVTLGTESAVNLSFSLLELFAFSNIILIILIGVSQNIAFGQSFQGENNSILYYGCEKYTGISHCDRLHNKLESYKIKSTSSTIYNVTDTPTFVSNKNHTALQMYANHLKYITFSNTSTIIPKQFSIAFWIRATSLQDKTVSPSIGHIISQFNDKLTGGWSFRTSNMQTITNQTLHLTVYNDNLQGFSSPEVPISDNDFTHIVGTFDGEHVNIYRDGIFYGNAKFNGTYNNNITAPLTLGVASGSPMLYYWTGSIDDLRYYDRVISLSEIKKIANENATHTKTKNGLIGYWPFDGNLDDTSGNNRNGIEHTLISSMVFTPDGRLFFSEKDTGKIKIMKNGKVNSKPFALLENYYSNWEQGLLGLAVDPDFENNHFIYQYYTTVDKDTNTIFNRVVRITDVNDKGLNETIIIDRLPASYGYHSGGAMEFGPDDKLYITTGDATENKNCKSLSNSTTAICPAQDPNSLLGKVLRINRDGSIPEDNPFPNSPVYNMGHLNMYGIAFDKSGLGLVSENGGSLYDEINTIEKAANYGSPTFQPLDINPELSHNSIKPLRSYYKTYCLTQMIYYDGNKLSHLKDRFLVGSLSEFNSIFSLQVNRITKQIVGEEVIYLDNFPNNQVVGIAQSPSGDLYYGGYAINKLESLNVSDKSQLLFPLEIIYSDSISNISYVSFIPSNRELIIDFFSNSLSGKLDANSSKTSLPHTYLQLNIPRKLLDEIYTVKNMIYNQDGSKQFTTIESNIQDDRGSKDTTINISIKQEGHYRLSILGNSSKF